MKATMSPAIRHKIHFQIKLYIPRKSPNGGGGVANDTPKTAWRVNLKQQKKNHTKTHDVPKISQICLKIKKEKKTLTQTEQIGKHASSDTDTRFFY